MAFWKVAGFSQPSPIEQILDKEEYTLEELLDEDDLIQECKSLNGRLVTFLREKKTVEQLLRYLVEPPADPDDPKKQYRYPFTACEVFCCEVEAIFNTLLEDEELLALLFSLLEQEPPLSCKAAGYFGRVVGQLLLRKTNEMMQHLSNNDEILERLIRHVDTTSIADIIKRLVGADDHSSMIFLPMHTQWLAETPLVEMLLGRLAPGHSPYVQANAADILTAIAHTQPSALATQLMQQQSIDALFVRALEPGSRVLVTALDVCAALLEPRRSQADAGGADDGSQLAGGGGGGAGAGTPAKAHGEAVTSMLQYVPQLMQRLGEPSPGPDGPVGGGPGPSISQETPYGLLAPPLGRARLRIVELLAALLRVGDDAADAALIAARALPRVQELFAAYPFNNLLHHQMFALLLAALRRSSEPMVEHIFGAGGCALVSWLAALPEEVEPAPRPGGASGKGALRAGYLGHVTRMGHLLQEVASAQPAVAEALRGGADWDGFVARRLTPRLELEDVTRWQCGRPVSTEGGELDSDGDEFQNDMESLEQMQGMPPGMYHRYGVLDDMDDDDDDAPGDAAVALGDAGAAFGGASAGAGAVAAAAAGAYSADSLVAGMAGLGVSDAAEDAGGSSSCSGGGGGEDGAGAGSAGIGNWSLLAHPGASSSAVDIPGERSMEDDAVLLADDEEMGALTASTLQGSPPSGGQGSAAASPPVEEMVLIEQADALPLAAPGVAARPAAAAAAAPVAAADPSSKGGAAAAADTGGVAAGGAAPPAAASPAAAQAAPLPPEGATEAAGALAAPAAEAPAAPAAAAAAAAAAATVPSAPTLGRAAAEPDGGGADGCSPAGAKLWQQTLGSHPVQVPEEL